MANAATLRRKLPARIMIVGYPGTAKTGSLVSLANAGYKLRVLDFDGNIDPLLLFTDPAKLENIDIVNLQDNLKDAGGYIGVNGLPTAFARGLKLMDRWAYKDEDGNEVDLGRSKDWGPDTIVVVDSLTRLGDAAFRRALGLLNRTPANVTQQVWQLAMKEQEAFIDKLTNASNNFHIVVLAHLTIISPKDVTKDDADLTKDIKEQVADLIPARLFPSALGQKLPPKIGGYFPTLLLAEADFNGANASRKLKTITRPDLDLKIPAKDFPKSVDISDGLLKVFDAITPGTAENLRLGAEMAEKAEQAKVEKA
jgi:hypothetical protein